MNCPHCGANAQADARFCSACGNALGSSTGSLAGETPTPVGERRQATILFCDLTGFTALGERLDPEEVRDVMGRVFGEAARIVIGYGGVVEKYIGDAVMAVFGMNQAHEDDALRAVRAAREIRHHIRTLSARYGDQASQALDVHSGINSGVVVTGQIGAQAGAMGVVGDAVNVAARLSGLAQPGEIILGAETAVQVQRFFYADELAPVALKGKAESVRVFRLGEPRERPTATRRLTGVHACLVGREVESALLRRAPDQLRDRKVLFARCRLTRLRD